MRSCGEPFHHELAKSDLFNNELARMADRSIWCATEIQRLVLALLQEWAYEIKMPAFSVLFNRLKQRGLPFGPRGQAADQLFQPYPGLSPPSPGHAGGSAGNGAPGSPSQTMLNPHIGHPRHRHGHHGEAAGAAEGGSRPSSRGGANLGPDLLRPGRTHEELLADLVTARETVGLLNEVLEGAQKEANWGAVKEEYCGEVAGACKALMQRLAALLGSGVTDEVLVAQALEVNDEAQKALDKKNQLLEVAEGRRSPPTVTPRSNGNGNTAAALPSPRVVAEPVPNLDGPPAAAAAPAAAPPAAPVNLMDLLDLDWTPAPEEEASKTNDPFLPPAPMVPPPRNNPFASAPATGEPYNPPAVTAERVPGQPDTSTSAAAAAAAESNPFMNDDAFAQLSVGAGVGTAAKQGASSPMRPSPGAPPSAPASAPPPPAPSQSSRPSGNPFAAFDSAAPGPSPALTTAASGAFNRPPPVVIPGSGPDSMNSGYIPTPGPFTAPPAFPGAAPSPGYAQYNQYNQGGLSSAGGSMQYHSNPPQHVQQQQYLDPHQQQYPQIYSQGSWGAPAAVPSAYLSVPPAHTYAPPGAMQGQGHSQAVYGSAPMQMQGGMAMPGRQTAATDSFKDLVVLKPKREEMPPPPKGAPMRRGGSASSSTPSVTGSQHGGFAPSSRVNTGNGNGRVSPPVAPPVPAQQDTAGAGWSAFDAFDTIGR